MSNARKLGVHQQIHQEHQELRELLGRVHRTLAKRAESAASVAAMIKALRGHVQTHFDAEEHGGFFDEVVAEAPRLSEQTEAIKQEHARLSATMRHLVRLADEPMREGWWQQVEQEFHQFSNDLMHHESREINLLLEAYGNDVGAPD